MEQLIAQRVRGIVHVVSQGSISNVRIMELYQEICDPGHHFTVRQPGAKSRPPVLLSGAKLHSLGVAMRPTEEALIACMRRYR